MCFQSVLFPAVKLAIVVAAVLVWTGAVHSALSSIHCDDNLLSDCLAKMAPPAKKKFKQNPISDMFNKKQGKSTTTNSTDGEQSKQSGLVIFISNVCFCVIVK